ncbi:MAG: homoserine dehydrogenase [Ferrimicrobium sp.]
MRVGLLGCGTVGSALVRLLQDGRQVLEERLGEPIEIAAIAVRNLGAQRDPWIPTALLTSSMRSVVEDPTIDVVVELVGAGPDALDAIKVALRSGKSVVTANKAVLSDHFAELEELAMSVNRDIFFEAAVAGAIPLIRTLRVSLIGEQLRSVIGVVNGTTNYILTRMDEDSLSFEAALEQAQLRGFAEADPTADLSGADAAAKVAIIASLAFGQRFERADVHQEGIEGIAPEDIAFARRAGYVIKLIARAQRYDRGDGVAIEVSVAPTLVSRTHPLSGVRDAYNAVFIEGDAVGDLMFYGPGAGGPPTASAVLGDLIEAAHNLRMGIRERTVVASVARVLTSDEIESRFYLAMDVVDAPGVLSTISHVFGSSHISIASMEQVGVDGLVARLVFLTHLTSLAAVESTADKVKELPEVLRLHRVMRLLDVGIG